MQVKGTVVSGLREGGKFVSMYSEKIAAITGFVPFLGTLNVDTGKSVKIAPEAAIPSFNGYGAVGLKRCTINNRPAYLVFPEKTKHSKATLEVISDVCLRARLGLRDGNEVAIGI